MKSKRTLAMMVGVVGLIQLKAVTVLDDKNWDFATSCGEGPDMPSRGKGKKYKDWNRRK